MQGHKGNGVYVIPAANRSGRVQVHDFIAFLANSANRIDTASLHRAAEAHRQTGQRIDTVLTELGLLSTDAVATALCEFFQLSLANRSELPLEPIAPELLESDFLQRNRILPLAASETELVIGTDNPFDRGVIEAISYYLDRPVRTCLVRPRDLDEALERCMARRPAPSSTMASRLRARRRHPASPGRRQRMWTKWAIAQCKRFFKAPPDDPERCRIAREECHQTCIDYAYDHPVPGIGVAIAPATIADACGSV